MSKGITTGAPSLMELAFKFADESACLDLLESLRWPCGPVCPRCGCEKAYPLDHRTRRLHECGNPECRHQFSVTSGTIMHRTRLSLVKWIMAIALMANARKGVSACQMARDIHVTYKTSWYLAHRIRRAMREQAWLRKFNGIVELDETYVGGRERGGKRGRGALKSKSIVFGAKDRSGKVRIKAIPDVTAATLKKAVHEYVDTDAKMVVADQYNSYNQLAAEFTLERIDHTREYVRGKIHTNGIESIWAIVKRQVNGTHHKLSKQYLPLYLGEISYRYNHRHDPSLYRQILANALVVDREIVAMGEAA